MKWNNEEMPAAIGSKSVHAHNRFSGLCCELTNSAYVVDCVYMFTYER